MNIVTLVKDFPQIRSLSKDQQEALILIFHRRNALINGEPGTGKTHLIKTINEVFIDREIALTAVTGSAARNIGGKTVSSFLRLGIYEFTDDEIMEKNRDNDTANGIDMLIVDEVSQLNVEQYRQIDLALCAAKGVYHKPFGGVQIVLVGDACQLEPLEGTPLLKTELGFPIVTMEKNFRQKDDPFFITLIKQMRAEVISNKQEIDHNLLRELVNGTNEEEVEGPIITSRHKFAETLNQKFIEELYGQRMLYTPEVDKGADLPPYDQMEYVIGMKVLHIVNKNGLVNGDIGEITDIDARTESVWITVNGEEKLISPFTSTKIRKRCIGEKFSNGKSIKIYSEDTYRTSYIPLIPCYALTVRRCQGLTLASGTIDPSVFHDSNPRIRYTAVSRFMKHAQISLLKRDSSGGAKIKRIA
jgi:ATP-dependent DNA helicase PIF1